MGRAWEQWQNSDMNATPFFYNAAANPHRRSPTPFLNRNQFGATIGGPIKKDKLFFFGSYQGVRISDGGASNKGRYRAARLLQMTAARRASST